MVEEQIKDVQVRRMEGNHPKGKEVRVLSPILHESRLFSNEMKAIFLVGGFGSSQYLKQCLQKAQPKIQIIQPPDAWSAIVRYVILEVYPN